MPREDTQRTASWLRTYPWAIAVALSAAIIGAGPADAAEGATFKPVQKGERVLIFKPRGVAPDQIDKAQVRIRHRRERTQRPVSTARVRNALRQRSTLRVRRPRGSNGGSLKVTIKRGGAAPVSFGSCSWGSFSASSQPGACWRPYGEASPFKRRSRASRSPQLGGDRRASDVGVAATRQGETGNSGTAGEWAHPIYYAQPSDPLYTIALHRTVGEVRYRGHAGEDSRAAAAGRRARTAHGACRPGRGLGVRLLAGRAKPSGGGTISVGWGGRTEIGTAEADGLRRERDRRPLRRSPPA